MPDSVEIPVAIKNIVEADPALLGNEAAQKQLAEVLAQVPSLAPAPTLTWPDFIDLLKKRRPDLNLDDIAGAVTITGQDVEKLRQWASSCKAVIPTLPDFPL